MALTPARACLKLERKFKDDVLYSGIQLAVSLFRKGACVYTHRYETRHDFRRAKLAEWKRRIAKRQNGHVPSPRHYFIQRGRQGEPVLTKLSSDLSQTTWLTRRKRKLIGPLPEEDARRIVDLIERAGVEWQKFIVERGKPERKERGFVRFVQNRQ